MRGLWTDEANEEAEKLMNVKMTGLNITGANSKGVSKEVFNSFYELTKMATSTKPLTAEQTNDMLNIKPEDITRTFLASIFADTVDNSSNVNNTKKRKSKYNTWDTMTVPKDYFYEGQPKIDTTIGRFIVNKFIFEAVGIVKDIGYQNIIVNGNVLEGLDKTIGFLYMNDIIDRKKYNEYTDRRDTLGYWTNGMLAHSISEKMYKPLPEIEKMKAELIKKYEKELKEGNIDIMTKISDDLIKKAKEILKDDPGMDLYDSGDLNFGNNYKNNSIIKGPVINRLTNEYDFIDTSFMDGIKKEDLDVHANSILAAQFPASIATADSGYIGKKLIALLQMMQIDEPGTDCGTKNLISVDIDSHNKDNMIYSYIEENGNLIELNPDNINSYVGKTVKMRSPETCLNEKICSKCAGNLFYKLNVRYAGLFATQISHAALNLGLKAKHDTVIKLYTIDPDEIIQDL